MALGELHFGFDRLPIAQNFHRNFVAHLTGAQRVGEVVEVFDLVIAEFNEDVALPSDPPSAAGEPGVTSANLTPCGTSPKSGILPK